MDHASFAGIVCIYIGSHTILGFVITPDSFRLTIFTCTMILVLDRVQQCHLLWRVAFYEKTCFLAEFFFKKCRQLQGPPYTGVNDRNIVCTLMFVCNIMYIYIISVFNFVIKHALFRHDNHRFDSNSRLLPVQYFARRSKSDNSIVFIFFYFPRAIT